MTTKKQPKQPISLNEEASPKDAGRQPATRRVAYKTVLVAVVIGIITISVLRIFMVRQEGSPVTTASVAESDVPAHESKVAKALPATKTDPVVESTIRKLASLSSQIDRSFEVQQIHSAVVKQDHAAIAENIQTIRAAVAELGASQKALARQISESASRLDSLIKDVQALRVVKRKPVTRHKPRPVKSPPFHVDAIDVWDDVTYVAVSQAGRSAFLKVRDQQSGWTVTGIDRLKGQVDFTGPTGQIHSVSSQR
jgi:ribosome-binding protein aMBF1 (putative translation factor)